MRVLFINNKDSFVYILVDYVAQQGCRVTVVDNSIPLPEVEAVAPDRIVISPGPGHPKESTGNTIPILHRFHHIPTLGVCLGHQAIAQAYGATVARAPQGPRHGKTSLIHHDGLGVLRGLPNPFEATRYHSLAVLPHTLPSELTVSARAEDGTIMGIRHGKYPVEGLQFHPESILTKHGMQVIRNFLSNPTHS